MPRCIALHVSKLSRRPLVHVAQPFRSPSYTATPASRGASAGNEKILSKSTVDEPVAQPHGTRPVADEAEITPNQFKGSRSIYRRDNVKKPGVTEDLPKISSLEDIKRGESGKSVNQGTEDGVVKAEQEEQSADAGLSIEAAMLSKNARTYPRIRPTYREPDAVKSTPNQRRSYKATSTEGYQTLTVEPLKHLAEANSLPPRLCHNLDRVLFNPGIYHLQDDRSRVYNFDPYLEHVMPVQEFDFSAIPPFVTSSKDITMQKLARTHGKKYVCSTSSIGYVLVQMHRLLSEERDLAFYAISRGFPMNDKSKAKLTPFWRRPASIYLRWRDGQYAIDVSKEFDEPNILSKLGQSLEKLLTRSVSEFERYRRSSPEKISETERDDEGAYHYSTIGNFLTRSQLDAHDPRLPGSGVFDLKTRAVHSIRHTALRPDNSNDDLDLHSNYALRYRFGEWESFEREYYDMMRSTALKYSLQLRMGNMDGMFVAYHNVKRIFGFQYISVSELDQVLHGQTDPVLGDTEYKMSMSLLDEVVTNFTQRFPEQSLHMYFDYTHGAMNVLASPITEKEIDERNKKIELEEIRYDQSLLGVHVDESEATATEAATPDSMPKHIAGVSINIQNTVNGADVQRPKSLSGDDTWEILYKIEDIPQQNMERIYEKTRKRWVDKYREKDSSFQRSYAEILKNYSRAGQQYLAMKDEITERLGKVQL